MPSGAYSKGYKGFIPSKIANLTTDAEYVANLVNINMWLSTSDSAVYNMVMLYLHNDNFLADIIGYDRLKFNEIYTTKMKSWVRQCMPYVYTLQKTRPLTVIFGLQYESQLRLLEGSNPTKSPLINPALSIGWEQKSGVGWGRVVYW